MKKTTKTNKHLTGLIRDLKKKSNENEVNIWKKIALDLNKPSRKRVVVNLFKINKIAQENETVIIPGKVLSEGDLNKKVTIAAFDFSQSALNKIKQCGSDTLSIEELIEKNPKGNNVRIIG